MMRFLMFWALVGASVAHAEPVKASYTPFDLAAGTISLGAHPVNPGETVVKLRASTGALGTQEACRLNFTTRDLERLAGRRCAPLWRKSNPTSLVVSVGTDAIELLWAETTQSGSISASDQLPRGKQDWAGYDRQKQRWVTFENTIPEGVVNGIMVDASLKIYAKKGNVIEAYTVNTAEPAPVAAAPPVPVPVPTPAVTQPEPTPATPTPAAEPVEQAPAPSRPPKKERPVREARPKPTPAQPRATRPVPTPAHAAPRQPHRRNGALRFGFATVFADAVDEGFDVRTVGAGGQGEVVRSDVAPFNLDFVVGYAPFLSKNRRSSNGCGSIPKCFAPYFGVSVAGQGGEQVEWLKALHLGVEAELNPSFSIGVTGVARRVTRLAEGAALGNPAVVGDPPPTVETVGFGVAVLLSATPRWPGR